MTNLEPWYLLIARDQDGSGVKQWLFRRYPNVGPEIDSLEPLAPVTDIVDAWGTAGGSV